ncbi:MAG: hypothetical protein ACRCSN_13230 [Dermatophilaceae bacterium]
MPGLDEELFFRAALLLLDRGRARRRARPDLGPAVPEGFMSTAARVLSALVRPVLSRHGRTRLSRPPATSSLPFGGIRTTRSSPTRLAR